MDTKKPRMKKEQQQYLLNFLMRNPETVNGNCQLPATKSLWTELTEALNGMGGVRKTQKDWLETYKLLARRAKAKMRTQRASMQRTGGGPPADICLTELEKKTINIEGTSTIYGLPGAVEAGIIIVPGTPQPIVDIPDPYVKQNIVMIEIIHFNATFPGSTHDAAVWQGSSLSQLLETNYVNGVSAGEWLLGDSGYAQLPWLMTPYADADENTPEAR
ncbi:unnamed protein product [Parnassius apollo]|uniref:(apollo) hypothetical protein n=1 Tax=Parnassius apollo TaxID=110799 RepID=A0A8S3XXP5_PARAO|nr:unnamed protein product [Parnassius apollo]